MTDFTIDLKMAASDLFDRSLQAYHIPASVSPYVMAYVHPQAPHTPVWRQTPRMPNEADLVQSTLEAHQHERWRQAVQAQPLLAHMALAVGRFLARPALDTPPALLTPEDWLVHTLADAQGERIWADAWLRGDEAALCGILAFLSADEQ